MALSAAAAMDFPAPAPDPRAMSEVAYLNPGKREQTKLANRQTILDAARAVFREIGFETATVRDIIRRTGLSVGAFYNYYRSKEEVIAALADDGARRFRPVLHAEYLKATDFESYLRGAVRAYFEFIAADHEMWGEAKQLDTEPYTRNTPEILAVHDEVRTALADVMERGLAPRVDLDYLATACIAIAREVGDEMLRRRPVDVEAAAEFCVRLILGGVAAAPRVGPAPGR
jgi:AcrR family transcriptional regulator